MHPPVDSHACQNGPDSFQQGQAITAAAPMPPPEPSTMLGHNQEPERSNCSGTVESRAEKSVGHVQMREINCQQYSSEMLSTVKWALIANETSETASWKPWSFHPGFIIVVIVGLHIAQISLVGLVLSKYKAKDGAFFVFGDEASAYFAWRFLPVMSAVLLGFLWGIVDSDVRRLEPFYQMNQPHGATVEDSLSLDYLSLICLVAPLVALSRRHYCVGLSSTLYLLALVVLPIAHDNMWEIEYNGNFRVVVNLAVVCAVLSLTSVMVVLAAILLFTLRTRRYGLSTDPGGLSGLASLIYNSNILPVFQHITVYQTQAHIDKELQNRRFQLRHTMVTREAGSSPVLVTRITSDVAREPNTNMTPASSPLQPDTTFQQSRWEAHPWVLWGRFLVLTELLFLGPYIAFQVAGYQAEFSSKVWSPKVIRILAMFSCTMTTALWTATDEGVRLIEPWRQLATDRPNMSRTNAIIADYDSMNPLSRIFSGSPIVAWISFGSLISQIFIVLCPALLDSIWKIAYTSLDSDVPETLQASTKVLGYASYPFAIMDFIIWVSLFSRRTPVVPRKPLTLSSKILYMCRSRKLLGDVHEATAKTVEQRAKNLRAQNREYRFGWFSVVGETGQLQLGVEREPVQLPYSYGHVHI
ncbi:hypothetical protein FGG08_004548 [Glutinoglossum americanum]|uniref:Transmembrane protein n=1 Tax=Glutinoglossum americanum TaxID=1670608 RepID=A0A9P8L2M2_9PEZI|nr:hypothetical protein FGG08_004548 [Glutinoglossum americanum]